MTHSLQYATKLSLLRFIISFYKKIVSVHWQNFV